MTIASWIDEKVFADYVFISPVSQNLLERPLIREQSIISEMTTAGSELL